MLAAMQTEDDAWPDDIADALTTLPGGHAFVVPEVLFAKITDEQREEWQAKFSGVRC